MTRSSAIAVLIAMAAFAGPGQTGLAEPPRPNVLFIAVDDLNDWVGCLPGTRCNQPVNLMDMYPTLLEMCSLPPRPDQAGVSFVPQLNNLAAPRDPSVTANEKGFTVRTERWRYIAYHDGAEELYDHERDPNEWDNLAGMVEFAEVKNPLKAFMPKNPAPARKLDPKPNAKPQKGTVKTTEVTPRNAYTAIP